MKFALFVLLALSTVHKPWREPHIISQRSEMEMHKYASPTWERHILIRNPLDRSVWFWIECETGLTSKAIGQPGHHTSEYVFPGIPPEEQCLINHWEVQREGVSPKEWRP